MPDQTYQSPCEICASPDWRPAYQGRIRDGGFGNLSTQECTVFECNSCGAQRLEESACKDDSFYHGSQYRELLGESADARGFWDAHDVHQLRNLEVLWPQPIRGRVVADVGCAAGSFLDHVGGLARQCLAIEPCREYHPSLRDRGYQVFDSIEGAASTHAGGVDLVFSFSTIEHVLNPLDFLTRMGKLLSPNGFLIVSTPNRADILMDLLGPDYQQFFYRTVHRWYFDMASLAVLADRGKMQIVKQRCLQRFGISNALRWLRDKRPEGDDALPGFNDAVINETWKAYLESKGVGDYLYVAMKRATD